MFIGGRNTFEFRQAHAVLNYQKAINWFKS